MQILTFLLLFASLLFVKSQWIDPHSMDTNAKNKIPNRSQNTQDAVTKKSSQVKYHCGSDMHLRRIVRLILSNAYLDESMGYREGYLNIRLTTLEHEFLNDFSKGNRAEDNVYSEISSIMENALQKTSFDRYQEIVLSLQEKLYNLIFNPTTEALVGACLALFITYKLIRAKFTWKSIAQYFLFLLWIMDFVIIYLQILHEEEINNMVVIKELGTVPPECDPKKMSWYTYFKTQLESTFSENRCKRYYQATFQNLKYFVAPSKVLTRQIKTLILEPCGDVGEAFGKFGRGMFTTLPWGLNVVLFPVMLISACALIFILFLFLTKPHFKLSLFHLFSIELGRPATGEPRYLTNNSNDRREIEYRCSRRRKNNGREVGHRALVEEVSHDNSSSGDKKNKKVSPKKIESSKKSPSKVEKASVPEGKSPT